MKEILTTVVMLVVFFFANSGISTEANLTKKPVEVTVNALNRLQGEVLAVKVKGDAGTPKGTFLQIPLNFQPHTDGWVALAGISYNVEPGTYPLLIEFPDGQKSEQVITVEAGNFKGSWVTVTESQAKVVNPTPADKGIIERKAADQEKIKAAYTINEAKPLWTEAFRQPTEGTLTTDYGYTRYINGKPNSRHSGWDLANVQGTPIYAANAGVVKLAAELLQTGNTIIIEHGAGVFSSYSHLSQLLVKPGDRVAAGALIGKMGSTGVSTGSHLHWVMRINDAYLHPGKFIGTDLFQDIYTPLAVNVKK